MEKTEGLFLGRGRVETHFQFHQDFGDRQVVRGQPASSLPSTPPHTAHLLLFSIRCFLRTAAWPSITPAMLQWVSTVCVLKDSLDQECTPASTALENLAVALSTASTDAVTMFGCFPTPKREPGTPGHTVSTIAIAKASAPVLRLRSS